MLLKNNLASKSDKKVTIFNGEMRRLIGKDFKGSEVTIWYKGKYPIKFVSTRRGTTWHARDILPREFEMPRIGYEVYHDIYLTSAEDIIKKSIKNQKVKDKEYLIDKDKKVSTDKFSLIRDWARQRGLYLKGDVKTQFLKLQEETGELAKAILKDDTKEVIDAIGDIVVVLTNLTELTGIKIESKHDIREFKQLTIEDCIDTAYNVIKNRTGKMQNGTFVKNEK
jgi:phosphoribosyl-ATP pyrophosphohydrolase